MPRVILVPVRGDVADEDVFAMALAIRYPDIETCKKALQSDVRSQSREVTGDLLKMFTGRVHHHVFDANEYPTK